VIHWVTGRSDEVVARLPEGSIDLFITSPPFYRLRSYLPSDHPDKEHEIGQEPTPGDFIDTLLRHVAEWRRALAPHGSIVIEIGDTSAGSGGAGGDYNADGLRDGQPKFTGTARSAAESKKGVDPKNRGNTSLGTARLTEGFPMEKSLCLIPDALAIALAYGFNPLNGNESPAGRWRVRNEVVWARTNPVVGNDGDKFRRAHSKVIVATLAKDRYWDIEELRTTPAYGITDEDGRSLTRPYEAPGQPERQTRVANEQGQRINSNPGGAPPLDWTNALASLIDAMPGARGIDVVRAARDSGIVDEGDVWDVPTTGYSGAHYAVFTPNLVRRPIVAMTPKRVCLGCGKPSRRIVKRERVAPADDSTRSKSHADESTAIDNDTFRQVPEVGWEYDRETVGWTECGCDEGWRPGRVCDPFGGSGTTGMVASAHGFDAILIDLDDRNEDLARERLGFMMTTTSIEDLVVELKG
jgi:site-specific DNA-methyltransferase (adenine-specific)